MNYPDQLEIIPLSKPPSATIRVPGSKSITNRALVLAALSNRSRWRQGCQIKGALESEDTQVMIEALRGLGFQVDGDVTVRRPTWDDRIPAKKAELFVSNSGTTMRFLTAMVSLGHGSYRLDGVPRMRERPIQDLIDALRQLGVRIYSERENGCPPVVVDADGLRGGKLRMRGDISSQFLSGLLLASPLAAGDITIDVEGTLVSQPYVDMTVAMMRDAGVKVDCDKGTRFTIPGRQEYRLRHCVIEPDASAASYFAGAAAINEGEIWIEGLKYPGPCLQGDLRFAHVLRDMGCAVGGSCPKKDGQGAYLDESPVIAVMPKELADYRPSPQGLLVKGRPPLRGIDVDMNAISDTVMTLAAVACFAEGPTTIRNVAHIRHKETDRIAALANELRKVGVEVEEYPDGLKITPRPLHGAVIETYNDHRMAMSMALIGLKVPGIIIKNPGCVAKTYPGFWQDLEKLR